MNPKIRHLVTLCVMTLTAPAIAAPDYPLHPVPFTSVRLTAGVLHDRQATNDKVTMPFALQQCDTSKRLLNSDLAADTMKRRAAGDATFEHNPPTQFPFDDSDVYKAVEGASFCLSTQPDPKIAAELESMISRVAAAQEPDGYLYTFRTMHPDSPAHPWIAQQRWANDPKLSHELYDLGHLYEAGVAYYQATGSRALLDICLKSANLLYKDFGHDGAPRIAPGHEVVEMGLAKLYRVTGDARWLQLAKFFLDARGHDGGSAYSQDQKPVVEQTQAVGHAVRANYLYSGMADVAALTGDQRYLHAITQIWDNIVSRKLHLTGGCGARADGEAYGDDYELPNRCYNETCAAVAFLFFNQRMFLMTGDAKYMDVFERTLYNGALSGVSLSGDRFFYPNPLEYDGHSQNNAGHAGRAPWFGCACCPPNILRAIASVGGYMAAVKDDTLFLNLYAQSDLSAKVSGKEVELQQTTRYPDEGAVTIKVTPDQPSTFTLALRIPCWSRGTPLPSDLYTYTDPTPTNWSVKVNGEPQPSQLDHGFVRLSREWHAGDTVTLDLPMPVRRVQANDHVAADRGLIALERGPIVYTFEGLDNDNSIFDAVLPDSATITPTYRPDFLGGATVLTISNAQRASSASSPSPRTRGEGRGEGSSHVFTSSRLTSSPCSLTAIPYALWANRSLTPMAVWLARDPSHARVPSKPTLAAQAKVKASFHRPGMDPARVNDQLLPRNATDDFAPNFDFWPHKGTTEALTYDFPTPVTARSTTVSWFDDTGRGECRLPTAWRLLYLSADNQWLPVENPSPYTTDKTTPTTTTFTPTTAKSFRLELHLPENFSSGLYEWELQ